MYKEFDFEDLLNRLVKVMEREPRSQADWARLLDINKMVFHKFINKNRTRMAPKNAQKLENFILKKEQEVK